MFSGIHLLLQTFTDQIESTDEDVVILRVLELTDGCQRQFW